MENSLYPLATTDQILAFFGFRDMTAGSRELKNLSRDELMYFRLEVGRELAARPLLNAV